MDFDSQLNRGSLNLVLDRSLLFLVICIQTVDEILFLALHVKTTQTKHGLQVRNV